MSIAFGAEPVPLRRDEHGDVRVGESRVLLDLVVEAFQDGATPEAIVQMYPTLTLADTYAAVSYYLRHPDVVADYLSERERRAEAARREIEAGQPDMAEIRRRLMNRRDAAGGGHAAPAQ